MTVTVWVAGEGNNDLGAHDERGERQRGAIDALLDKVCADDWSCVGKTEWRRIKKYRVRGATIRHGDYQNVCGLVLAASEKQATVVAFVRDRDSDDDRERAVHEALKWIRDESGWTIEVIGGVAKPALEGWIAALLGDRDTDEMSRPRVKSRLDELEVDHKSTRAYVDVIDDAKIGDPPHFGLPVGTESLRSWLARAHDVLNRLVA